ncbi:MAG: malate synthase A [Acidimicrobiia bacterium]|nr:malate synthase A [Acidimicrobiia bacterium]
MSASFIPHPLADQILTADAVGFLADLERRFRARRELLLSARFDIQARLDAGEQLHFDIATTSIRDGQWQVAPAPKDLLDRRVEITGPVTRKMMINALNSGAKVFMADFEDALSPTWDNVLDGQVNVRDAYRRTISLDAGDTQYRLADETATLVVRPRGWHLVEKHLMVDGEPMSASLFDFGLVMYHNARASLDAGSGPYFYLPKLESHLEARLWNDAFVMAQERLDIPHGTIKATVLIETIPAAFQMEEILYELRDHSAGLNAGRWDYIFSVAKKFARRREFTLPDRADVGMTAPFMRAYTELMIATCHRRGAHAIGGMAAFIPNRRDPEVTEAALAKVTEDKRREATDGCDGTWVAHPDLVPVAMAEFDAVLGDEPHQIDRKRDDVHVTASDLLAVHRTTGAITEAGVRTNVNVGLRYLSAWLTGTGAAALDNLMEDAATAEISRAQIWQWVTHRADLGGGRRVNADCVRRIINDELAAIEADLGADAFRAARYDDARAVFEQVALSENFEPFLTTVAYRYLD